jgi:phosphatidylglycerophosphatase A
VSEQQGKPVGDVAPARPAGSVSASTADRLAYLLAIWFGCGRIPRAPGTWGTLGALPLYWLLAGQGVWAVAGAAVVLTFVGVWAAGRVARQLSTHDPQIVCIDEVAGVLVTLTAVPRTLVGVVAAVALFRLFDVLKPWPARLMERKLPGGWGIVFDDIFAGLWGAAVLLGARALGLL